jgi:hypothetical protein
MENLRRDPLGRNALASLSHGDQHDKVPPFPHKISWHVGSKTEYLNPSFPVLIDSAAPRAGKGKSTDLSGFFNC